MRTITLSDKTYQRLLGELCEFGESAEDVIVRLLDSQLEDATAVSRATGGRASPGSILPERAYWKPILRLLAESGGRMPANDVIEETGRRMQSEFTDLDLQGLQQGEVRWRNRVRFARLRMKNEGLLSATSRRGIWEITDAGRRYLDHA